MWSMTPSAPTRLPRAWIVIRPRGMMVSFGQSSGPVGAVEPLTLSQKGSLFLTRPNLAHYISDPARASVAVF